MCVVRRCQKCHLVAKVRRSLDSSQRHNARIPHMHHGVVGWWGDGVTTFAAAVTRAMALAEEAKYAYTLAEEEKLRVNPHSNNMENHWEARCRI